MNLKNNEIGKRASAEKAALLVEQNMTIGLGTGSTACYFIKALGKRLSEGLKIAAVATSLESLNLALSLGFNMLDINSVKKLDLTIDGADEIDHKKQMIKGGGGALLREKIVAHMSSEMIVIVDETKYVPNLGNFALPIEIAEFAHNVTLAEIAKLGASVVLRKKETGFPFVTDNGNFTADLKLPYPVMDAETINLELKKIPGVLETGLFLNMAGRVIIGYQDGRVEII